MSTYPLLPWFVDVMIDSVIYVWPTVNTRNILATSPRGTEVIIGQQTIVKYYGNSARTKLIKTINKTFWI